MAQKWRHMCSARPAKTRFISLSLTSTPPLWPLGNLVVGPANWHFSTMGGGANRNLVHGVRGVYYCNYQPVQFEVYCNLLVCGAAAGALPRPGELLCAACADLVRLPSQPPLARPHTAGVCPLSGVKLELFNH